MHKVLILCYFHFTACHWRECGFRGRSRPWLVNGRGPPAVVLAGKPAFLTVQLLVGGIGPKVRTPGTHFPKGTGQRQKETPGRTSLKSMGSPIGARADIFRKPAASKALRFLRILPMTRERDGLRTVTGNYKTFDEIDDALAQHADLPEAQQYQLFRDQLYERISALVWPDTPVLHPLLQPLLRRPATLTTGPLPEQDECLLQTGERDCPFRYSRSSP